MYGLFASNSTRQFKLVSRNNHPTRKYLPYTNSAKELAIQFLLYRSVEKPIEEVDKTTILGSKLLLLNYSDDLLRQELVDILFSYINKCHILTHTVLDFKIYDWFKEDYVLINPDIQERLDANWSEIVSNLNNKLKLFGLAEHSLTLGSSENEEVFMAVTRLLTQGFRHTHRLQRFDEIQTSLELIGDVLEDALIKIPLEEDYIFFFINLKTKEYEYRYGKPKLVAQTKRRKRKRSDK